MGFTSKYSTEIKFTAVLAVIAAAGAICSGDLWWCWLAACWVPYLWVPAVHDAAKERREARLVAIGDGDADIEAVVEQARMLGLDSETLDPMRTGVDDASQKLEELLEEWDDATVEEHVRDKKACEAIAEQAAALAGAASKLSRWMRARGERAFRPVKNPGARRVTPADLEAAPPHLETLEDLARWYLQHVKDEHAAYQKGDEPAKDLPKMGGEFGD